MTWKIDQNGLVIMPAVIQIVTIDIPVENLERPCRPLSGLLMAWDLALKKIYVF